MDNIKLKTGEVSLLLGQQDQYSKFSEPYSALSENQNLLFLPPESGPGTYVWKLPGEGWERLTDLDDATQTEVRNIYEFRKNQILNSIPEERKLLRQHIFTIPSDNCICVRRNNRGCWDIALAGWGMKYPDRVGGKEMDAHKDVLERQEVEIGFIWDGKKLTDCPFKIEGYSQITGKDGMFHVDKPLPVGSKYKVTVNDDEYELIVEKGKDVYTFDLTRFFTAHISVKLDGKPLNSKECTVDFNGKSFEINTDENGNASLRLIYKADQRGKATDIQPECTVSCESLRESKAPSVSDDDIYFTMNFESPEEPKSDFMVHVTLNTDGQPTKSKECNVNFNGESHRIVTDENGKASLQLNLKTDQTGVIVDPQPECTVSCESLTESKIPTISETDLYFTLNFISQKEPPKIETPISNPEPEYVYFKVLDFGGHPMPDIPLSIKLAKKGTVELVSDADGRVCVDKAWITPGERIQLYFTVSKGYQSTHDIHRKK